jgi:cold shock CspA family protein
MSLSDSTIVENSTDINLVSSTPSSLVVEDKSVQSSSDNVILNKLTGNVKWFNSRSGYGFITVCGDNEYIGKDIFVHYTSINVAESQYKYLFQGEYVEFTLIKSTNSNHEFHAINVTGICGGPIMCETRRSIMPLRSQTNNYTNEYKDETNRVEPKHQHQHQHRSRRPDSPRYNKSGGADEHPRSLSHPREENTDGFSKVVSKRTKKYVK